MAGRRGLRGVLVSPDRSVRATLTEFARSSTGSFALVLDLEAALSGLTGAQFKAVHGAAPALVFIDFDPAPELGISLIRDLGQTGAELVVVGVGQPLGSEHLLQAMRAGLAEYLIKPVSSATLTEAVDRLRPRLTQQEETESLGRVLVFFGAKGGAGTSTAVTNLAVGVHKLTGERTLLVDLDAELGEVALLLGAQPKFNFVDLVQNFHRMDTELLGSYIEQHPSGVHLLSAPFHPVKTGVVTPDSIRQVIQYLRGQYTYVFVDTQKSFSPETLSAFEQADEVFLVSTVDLPSLRNVQRVLPMLKRLVPNVEEQVHLTINRYDPKSEVRVKDLERTLGLPIYATLANDYESVIRSLNSGQPVVLNGAGKKSPYARDIRNLAVKIAGAHAGRGGSPSGFFTKLFTGSWRTPGGSDD